MTQESALAEQPMGLRERPWRAKLSPWAKALGSGAVLIYLAALVVNGLGARSGPWPTMDGSDFAAPPAFAQKMLTGTLDGQPGSQLSLAGILRTLRITHNGRFESNQQPDLHHRFEAIFRDADGNEISRRVYPNNEANMGVRRRQQLLANGLGVDEPVIPPEGEFVPADGQQVRRVEIWDVNEQREGKRLLVPEHQLPRDRQLSAPSVWSQMLAASYARHLLRKTPAHSVEIVRLTQAVVTPDILFAGPNMSPREPELFRLSFGEYHADSK